MTGITGLLKEFTCDELKALERFINSPYHNNSRKVMLFFREIKKFYPDFADKKLTKEHISRKISPSLKYNDSTFRNLSADLMSLIEKFLIIEKAFDGDYDTNILLLKSLIEKKQNNLFDINLRKGLNKLEKFGIDNSYLYTRSQMELCVFNNSILNRSEKSAKNIQHNTNTLYNYIIQIINFFISELINSHLKLAVEDSKYNIGDKADFSSKIIENINISGISQIIKGYDKNNFILDLYLQLFLSFQNIDDSHYYLNYKSLIAKNYKKLSKDELSYHYSMLITYCILRNSFSDNKSFYDNELFGIYNTFLKDKLFTDKKTKYIEDNLFRNILVLSIRLKKFQWAFDFISRYSKFLHPDRRNNILNFSLAEYYYHSGSACKSVKDLNRAFEHLTEIKEESFIIKYDIRILYLMIYYDLGYIDNLLSQLKNYRLFLCRNYLITREKKKKLNCFLNILEKLVYLKEGNPNIDITKLSYDVSKLKKFNYQRWLLDKVQALNVKPNYFKLKQV